MRKILLSLLALTLSVLMTHAQTDVTSKYLSGGSFENCTAASASVSGTNTAATTGTTNGEWTYTTSGPWSCSAIIAYGQSTVTLASVTAPSTDNAGNTGNALGVSVGWDGNELWVQTNAVKLPAGKYTLKYYTYNNNSSADEFASKVGFVTKAGTNYLSTKTSFTYGTWVEDKVVFTLSEDTDGKFQVGGSTVSGTAGSSTNAKVFFDNLTLTYTDLLAGAKEDYQTALATAKTAIENNDYTNVTGEERTALQSAINATISAETAEAYATATTNLTTATTAFTDAKSSYDRYVARKAVATDLNITVSVDAPTSATAAIAAVQTIAEAIDSYYTTGYTIDVTSTTGVNGFDSWTFSSTTESTTKSSGTSQHWSGTDTYTYYEQSSSSWGTSSFTDTYSKTVTLPTGEYMLKFAARGSLNLQLTAAVAVGETTQKSISINSKGDTGYGIATDGSVSFTSSGTYANDGAGRGWEWYYLPVTVTTESSVTFTITAETSNQYQWFSLANASFLTTNANTTYAVASDAEKTALNSAITSAETHKLGFNKDEYAPYNNVVALTALANAETLAAAEAPIASEVVAATEALTAATWTANAEDLDAVYDGNLTNKEVSAETGDADPVMKAGGWTTTGSFRMIIGDTETYPALTETEVNKAVFAWAKNTYKYGETTGYTMPLDANTVYELSFKHAGWNGSISTLEASVLNSDNEGLASTDVGSAGVVTAAGGFANNTLYFSTGAAGDYVLSFSFTSGNAVLADIHLVKASAEQVTITKGGNNADNTAYYATCQTSTPVNLDRCEFDAYTVKVTDGTISYTKAEGTVPAGTCLLISAEKPGQYEAAFGLPADAQTLDTDLQPAGSDEKGDGSTKYILDNGTNGLGWYLCTSDAKINEGVCYLVIENSSNAKFIGIDGDATGISSVTPNKGLSGVRYNVSGQRVGANYKGIVIENGKKYLVK